MDAPSLRRHPVGVAPRTRRRPQAVSRRAPAHLPREVEGVLRAGLEAAARGVGIDLTEEEAEHYHETGELPEHVQRAGELWAPL
jgi:hypothetical protein